MADRNGTSRKEQPAKKAKLSKALEVLVDEIPALTKLKDRFDRGLQRKMVDPATKAGYGSIGAGTAAALSAALDLALPSSPAEMIGEVAGGTVAAKAIKVARENKKLREMIDAIQKVAPWDLDDMLSGGSSVDEVVDPELIAIKKRGARGTDIAGETHPAIEKTPAKTSPHKVAEEEFASEAYQNLLDAIPDRMPQKGEVPARGTRMKRLDESR